MLKRATKYLNKETMIQTEMVETEDNWKCMNNTLQKSIILQ